MHPMSIQSPKIIKDSLALQICRTDKIPALMDNILKCKLNKLPKLYDKIVTRNDCIHHESVLSFSSHFNVGDIEFCKYTIARYRFYVQYVIIIIGKYVMIHRDDLYNGGMQMFVCNEIDSDRIFNISYLHTLISNSYMSNCDKKNVELLLEEYESRTCL